MSSEPTTKVDSLIEFLQIKMNMSHIYQPLLIKSLVEAGGKATIRQLANHFLSRLREIKTILILETVQILLSCETADSAQNVLNIA